MSILRDPVWQFVGVLIAVLTVLIPVIVKSLKRRSSESRAHHPTDSVIGPSGGGGSRRYEKHKKRKPDGILLGNISSDFFNQFPASVQDMVNNLDSLYTPENFGGSDWLSVFRRFTKEDYFVSADGKSVRRIGYQSMLNPGPKLDSWLRDTGRVRRQILGIEEE
jgi:hypothetical protein